MRSSPGFLWQFIHAMSKQEKLFFKRNFIAASAGKHPLYIRLFDAIEKQGEYDEAAILKKFAPALHKKNIAFQKHYLYRQLCQALIEYEGRSNAEQEVYNLVLLTRLLRKKGLPEEAHGIWKKAVQKARHTESFSMLGILKKEFEKMILWSSAHTGYDELHAISGSNIINYGEYAALITLRDIYAETLLLKRKAHYDLDEETRTKVILLLDRVNNSRFTSSSSSFWFRHYYRMNKATLQYLLNQDAPGTFSLIEETLADWQQYPHYIETDAENFIEVMNMINLVGVQQGKYQYVEHCFHQPLNDKIREGAQRANFELIKFMALNKVYNKTARYAEVARLIQYIKPRHQQWEPFVNNDLNRAATLSLGIAFFVLEKYTDALHFTKKGITSYKDGTHEEHMSVGYMLLLLITYALDNDRLFEAQYRSSYSYFYKRKKKHPFETGLTQCLNRTFYMKGYKEKITEYRKTLAQLEAYQHDEVQQRAFSIFNYPGWLQSRIERISYKDYVKRKVMQQ